jgi:uncharacterized protein (DUF2235 family)
VGARQATIDDEPEPAASPSTARQIVVCCDGTNNTVTGGVKDTNVLQLFATLKRHQEAHPQLPDQDLYYDPGVGSVSALPPTDVTGFLSERISRMTQLGLGRGVYDNIGQAYLHLCREYGRDAAPGAETTTDEIYLFGFSRGAFTVRAVAGMVNLFGLIKPEHETLLPTLLRVYFAAPPKDGPAAAATERAGAEAGALGRAPGTVSRAAAALQGMRSALDPVSVEAIKQERGRKVPSARIDRTAVGEQIRQTFTTPIGREAVVYFVGVWDTVDSVGLPGFRKSITSPPTISGKRFRHVRQALALDEHRKQFLPREYRGPVDPDQTLKQLWFRGVHTDIGGGKPVGDSRLSSETMHWMVAEARSVGLRCPDVPVATHPKVEVIADQLRAQPLWALTGMALRDPERAEAGSVTRGGFVTGPREHPSVAELSPPSPGGAPPAAPGSPWAAGKGPRMRVVLTWVIGALVLGVASWIAAGATATPGPFEHHWWAALKAGANLSWDQVTTFWWPPSARDELARWAAADTARAHASYGWAMVFTLGFTAGAATLLARLVARAFGRLTMWRRVGWDWPSWLPNAVGQGYLLLVIGFVGETIAVVLAWAVGASILRTAALLLALAAAAAALVGAVLVAALMLRWTAHEVAHALRRRSRSTRSG